MKFKKIFTSVLSTFFVIFNCINAHAIIFNDGPNGNLEATIDFDTKTIIFIAGPKKYTCNFSESTYECDDGTKGKFRNFIPFSSEGTLPPCYMNRIRVAIIFYGDKFKFTYLTDGTIIQETYIDRSIDKRTRQIKTGTFSLSSSIDDTIETVKGTTCIVKTCYYCCNGFDEQNSIEKYQPGYNPYFADARTEYQVYPDNPGTGLYLFHIFLSNGGICLQGGDFLSKSHITAKKLMEQQGNQIFKLSRLNRQKQLSIAAANKNFEILDNSSKSQDHATTIAIPQSSSIQKRAQIYEPLLKKEGQVQTTEHKNCLQKMCELLANFSK